LAADICQQKIGAATTEFCTPAGAHLELLNRYAMVRGMSGKGNCYANALVESFVSLLKNDIIHHRDYHIRD
jgi:transposase InsO family protein